MPRSFKAEVRFILQPLWDEEDVVLDARYPLRELLVFHVSRRAFNEWQREISPARRQEKMTAFLGTLDFSRGSAALSSKGATSTRAKHRAAPA